LGALGIELTPSNVFLSIGMTDDAAAYADPSNSSTGILTRYCATFTYSTKSAASSNCTWKLMGTTTAF